MKKVIFVLVLFASALVGCQNAKPSESTYTITIQETEHFIPDKTSLTFKENDFSPIILSYSTDKDYLVLDAKASDESATCHVDYQKDNEIEIIPCKNANFTVQVTMTHFSDASIVRIDGDTHFHPERNKIVFKNNDFRQISIHFTLDNYCALSEVKVTRGEANCTIDESSNLLITPNANGEIIITVKTSEQYKIIDFDPNEGTLSSFAKESLLIPYGSAWQYYVNIDKQHAIWKDYAFKGWSFTENPGIGGEIIESDYVVNESTPNKVYAVYEHNIRLTSDSLSVDRIEYNGNLLEIHFSLKNDVKYVLPNSINDFTLTNKYDIPIVATSYTKEGGEKKAYIQISSPEAITDGLIKITVNDNQPTYSIDYDNLTHLAYSNIEGELAEPVRGEDFKFRLDATVDEPGRAYYVPDDIEVKIGGEVVSSKAYTIQPGDLDRLYAIITIYGNYIKGNITIRASAPFKEGYIYKAYGCGVTFDTDGKTYVDGGIPYGGSDTIEIDVIETTGLTSNNIAVKFDETKWYAFNNLPDEVKDYFAFNDATKHITIKPNVPEGLFTTVAFHIFDQGYDIFEKASWAEINEIASIPGEYMSNFFSVGDTREVTLSNNYTYTLRIIGFNHDPCDNSNRNASLTIEFVELLVNDDGTPLKKYFAEFSRDVHYEYSRSDYDYYLTNPYGDTLFARLPTELQDSIKWVNKACNLEKGSEEYATKIFALSLAEMNASHSGYPNKEGTLYKYYEEDAKNKRKKHFLNQTDSAVYWSRSIYQDVLGSDFIINDDGGVDFKVQNRNEHGYMAAFCI